MDLPNWFFEKNVFLPETIVCIVVESYYVFSFNKKKKNMVFNFIFFQKWIMETFT